MSVDMKPQPVAVPTVPKPGGVPGFKLGPLYFTLPLANVALYMLWIGIGAFVLPFQVIKITGGADPDALKTASTIGAVLATIGNPLFGLISDRTRSRFGRRAPWILLCGFVGAGLLVLQAQVTTIAMLGISWGAIQFMMNGYQAALTAVMPDRVPEKKYGTFSALVGFGIPLGTILAAFLLVGLDLKSFGIDKTIGGFDGMFVDPVKLDFAGGYYLIGGFIIVAALLFVFLSPDRSNKHVPREPFSMAAFFKSFAINPKQHPDFILALVSRLGVMLGYFLIFTYTSFILLEHIHVPMDRVGGVMGSQMALNAVCTLIAAAFVGPIVDRVGRIKPFVIASGVLTAASLAIPMASPTEGGMAIFQAVNGVALGVYMAVDMALIAKVLPNPDDAGKDMGLINIANAGPQILAPTIAAFIISDLGGYGSLFPIAACISIVGALLAMKIKSVK